MNFLRWARVHWDRAVAVLAAIGGAVAIFLGWSGASQSAYPAEQLPYLLSGGLIGMVLFGAGATLWLSADLRDEWAELRGIRDELRAANEARTAGSPADELTNGTPVVERRNGNAETDADRLADRVAPLVQGRATLS
jgi:hypothetical protein